MKNSLEPKVEKTGNYAANINDWAKALQPYNKDLAGRIDEKREVGFANVERLGLPRYKHRTILLTEFLKNRGEYFREMESEKFFVSLEPLNHGLGRIGKAGLNRKEVIELIFAFIAPENQDQYKVLLNQFFDNIFGGTIVVDKNGNPFFEFIRGNQTGVGKGNVDIEFRVWRDNFTKNFKYSFEDEIIREIAHMAIMSVPHSGEGREMIFLTGYYELVIARKDKSSRPQVFFLDYRDNVKFTIEDLEKVELS